MTQATEVREELDRIRAQEYDRHIEGVSDTVEQLMEAVVEEGSFYPDVTVVSELDLTLRERLSGKRQQDMTAMLMMGVILGAALERDVPEGTELEEKWRNGEFELPETQYE